MPPKKTEREVQKTLAQTIPGLIKKYDTRIGGLNDAALDVLAISTGNLSMDAITGVGGLPCGRMTELYGPPSSGKTTLGLQTAVVGQRKWRLEYKSGGVHKKVAYIDHECALDRHYAAALGLDQDEIIFVQPDTLEEGAAIGRALVKTGEVGMIIYDSVAAMTPEQRFAEAPKGGIALQARLMAEFLAPFVVELKKTGCVGVFLNHIAEVIDITPMGQQLAARGVKRYTTPGGRALKFYASLRMEFKQVGGVKEESFDSLTGVDRKQMAATNTQVTVMKNKVAPPFGQAQVQVRYGKGFSQEYSAMSVLVAHSIIKKSANGGIYTLPDDLLKALTHKHLLTGEGYIKGEANLLTALEEDASFRTKAVELAVIAASETNLLVSQEMLAETSLDPDQADPSTEEESAAPPASGDITDLLTGG